MYPINADIAHVASVARKWLRNSALPIWFEKGVDWNYGGFFEYLNYDDLSCAADYKRVRVLARQIFVFCIACQLGDSYAQPAITHGLEFLLDKHRLKSGGFASITTNRGRIIERPLDLYDLSFCLFALAHSFRIFNDNYLKDEAITLANFISDRFRHSSGGYAESFPATLPRRQNPHMHLLEALLEWQSFSENSVFRDISEEIVSLFFEKFYLCDSGALLEYFDDELRPSSGHRGDITEPGHHFEWVWLLRRYHYLSGRNIQPYMKLYDFAYKHGINVSNGLLWGGVTSLGAPCRARVRLWPHAEWIKAELSHKNERDLSARVSQAWNALDRFLNCPQPGLWYETYDHNTNNFLLEPSPASSLYHITCAIEAIDKYVKTQSANYDIS